MTRENENVYYYTALVLGAVLLAALVLYRFWLKNYISIPGCWVAKYFGMYCPGCGGTRAIIALLHGNIVQSFLYHPLVIYFCAIFVVYVGTQTFARVFRFQRWHGLRWRNGYVYIGVVLLMVHTIVRNVLLLVFQMPMA